MITSMKKLEIYGATESRKAVMEQLQKLGCVEFKEIENEDVSGIDVSENILKFERTLNSLEQALEILEEYSPEKKGMFSVRKSVSMSDCYSMTDNEMVSVGKYASDIIKFKVKIQDNTVKIGREKGKILNLSNWEKLDVPMDFSGSKNTNSSLYTVPFEATTEILDNIFETVKDYVYYEQVSVQKDISCVFVIYLKDFSQAVEKLLREQGFVQPGIEVSSLTAQEKVKAVLADIEKLETENKELEEKIAEYSNYREELKLLSDHLSIRIEKYENLKIVGSTSETFIVEGYVPENKCQKVKRLVESAGICCVEFFDVPSDEEAPVLLVNNGFAKPVEGITKTYSMPSKHDIDPNFIMAIFYYIFFGMMFSDAGYGLLMVLGAGYFAFFAKVEESLKNTMKMFFFCGISTTFWGLLYGSFFGDAVYRISTTFFGKEISLSPIWIDPVKEPLTLLIFSVVLGVIQILVGLGIKFYVDYRRGEKASAIFDTGSWMLVLLGIGAFASGFALKIDILFKIGIGICLIGVLMIVLMKGRETKNPIVRIFNGILGLYDITSFASDALSYSRLMALGLATGVIAQVVNIMGTLAGNGVVSVILFIVVSLVGHSLNFAINALGAYVHTNRLQYVEFYSKFYEGGGREFSPLSVNTKYFKFMEEE